MRRSRYNTLIETLPDGTQIWVSAEKEDVTPEQEARSIGGGAHGRSFVRNVRRAMRDWGRWGWCTIAVTAVKDGAEGVAYLGCSSYESGEDFARCNTYPQERQEALQELSEALLAAGVTRG